MSSKTVTFPNVQIQIPTPLEFVNSVALSFSWSKPELENREVFATWPCNPNFIL